MNTLVWNRPRILIMDERFCMLTPPKWKLTRTVPGHAQVHFSCFSRIGLHIITYNANGLLVKQKRQGMFEVAKAKNVYNLILHGEYCFSLIM